MRQVQVVHVAGKVGLADLASEARIETPLLRHARHRETAIVVRGVEQASLWQREYLGVHRAIERMRIALLEVRAPAAAYQQAVPGKCHAFVVEDIGETSSRVARRGTNLEMTFAEFDLVALRKITVGSFGAAGLCHRDPASKLL